MPPLTLARPVQSLLISFAIVVCIAGLGGPTSYAANPARDLGEGHPHPAALHCQDPRPCTARTQGPRKTGSLARPVLSCPSLCWRPCPVLCTRPEWRSSSQLACPPPSCRPPPGTFRAAHPQQGPQRVPALRGGAHPPPACLPRPLLPLSVPPPATALAAFICSTAWQGKAIAATPTLACAAWRLQSTHGIAAT